jgi:phage head maturation protease
MNKRIKLISDVIVTRTRNTGTRKLSELRTRAQFDVASFNEEARTVDIVFATETPVLTRNWRILEGAQFNEVLSMDSGHIRMERANQGLPVLKDHYNSVDNQVGIATEIRIANKEARAKVTFSSSEDGTKLMNDVKDGIVRNISCGYRVYAYAEVPVDGQNTPTLRATDWEPMEISFVAVPADMNSSVRADGAEEYQVEIQTLNRNIMKREQLIAMLQKRGVQFDNTATDEQLVELLERSLDNPSPAPNPAPNPTPAPAPVDHKQRSADITAAVRAAKLGDEYALELINSDVDVNGARAAIIAKLAANQPTPTPANAHSTVGNDRERGLVIETAEAAIVSRSMPDLATEKNGFSPEALSGARKLRGSRLLDLAKESLKRAGENIEGLDPMAIVGRAFTSSTSDFPVLLEGANRRVLLANYNAAADTWIRFCATGSVSDFREYKRLRMGTFSDLESLGENEEYKNKKITDADYEKVSVATKGNIINISRKMIINDDLAAFMRLSQMLGRAAARSIENDVFAFLASNPTLTDGKTLFHADHNNIAATGGAPTVDLIDAIRQQMAQHKDKDANDYLDIRPSIALAPLSLGSKLRLLNTSQYDPDKTNKLQYPNVVGGLFSDVIDTPRLSGTAWYMFANPSEEPVFEVNFLNGVQEPYMESENGFDVDGIRWKIRLDYGVGAVGYRGVVKNAGA